MLKTPRRTRTASASCTAPGALLQPAALANALHRCRSRERVLLALMLYERLTPLEAANALGWPVRQVERTYRALLAELKRSVRGAEFRPGARPRAGVAVRLRRAS